MPVRCRPAAPMAVLSSAALLAACLDTTRQATSPTSIQTDIDAASAKPRLWVRIEPQIAQAGCATAIRVGQGSSRVAVVSRGGLPFALPQLDSVPRGGTSRAVLQVVHYRVVRSIGGTQQQIVLSCLAPYNRGYEAAIAQAVRAAAQRGDWTTVERALRTAPVQESPDPLEIVAGRILLQTLFPTARKVESRQTNPRTGIVGRTVNHTMASVLAATSSSAPDGAVLARTDTAKAQVLGPVEVWASRMTYLIDTRWLYLTLERVRSFSDFIDWDYYLTDGPDCAAESEYYLAEQEEIRRMEDHAPLLDAISEALTGYVCERIPSKPICIDFFIMNERSAVFGGDNRDFDSTGSVGHSGSRVQVYFNPTTLEWEVKINSSRLYFGGIVIEKQDSARLFRPGDVKIYRDPQHGIQYIRVELKFFNNFCPTREFCPAIDATLWFQADSTKPGGYEIYWDRDGFPSMAVQHLRADGGWDLMVKDPEMIKSSYWNWLGLIDSFKRSSRMPPGCNLQ
jgi:hypothetical protein